MEEFSEFLFEEFETMEEMFQALRLGRTGQMAWFSLTPTQWEEGVTRALFLWEEWRVNY